jgi:hypothetical protein
MEAAIYLPCARLDFASSHASVNGGSNVPALYTYDSVCVYKWRQQRTCSVHDSVVLLIMVVCTSPDAKDTALADGQVGADELLLVKVDGFGHLILVKARETIIQNLRKGGGNEKDSRLGLSCLGAPAE